MNIKTLFHGGHVTETKQQERNGVKVGIVAGYIATWDADRGDWTGIKDQFVRGAFKESIARHVKTGRQVRLKDQHGRTIGGFPIETVKEDSKGLFGSGEINLEVQQGREAFALAKQGVLSDFSIGWEPTGKMEVKDGIRKITKSEIWEGSIVDEPMNPKANIIEVKSIELDDIEALDEKGLERLLVQGIKLTNHAAKKFVNRLKESGMFFDEQSYDNDGLTKIYNSLQEILKNA